MTEQATFCGIEIPLTMECLLRVFGQAVDKRAWLDDYYDEKMTRQVNAFRNRILRMYEVIESEREMWKRLDYAHSKEKDERIAELEKELDKLYKEKSNRGAAIRNM